MPSARIGGVGNRLLGRDRGTGIVADIDATASFFGDHTSPVKDSGATRAPDLHAPASRARDVGPVGDDLGALAIADTRVSLSQPLDAVPILGP